MSKNPFEKFTKEAKQVLQTAEKEAKSAGLHYIGTEHLLLGVLSDTQSLGYSLLLGVGVSYENVKLVIESTSSVGDASLASAHISTYLAKVIEDAVRIAVKHKHSFVGTEHLLFALTANRKCAAAVVLENMEIHLEDFQKQIEKILGQISLADGKSIPVPKNLEDFFSGLTGALVGAVSQNDKPQSSSPHNKGKAASGPNKDSHSATPALDYFGTDLTTEARDNKLDPVIGRKKEIERVIRILNRKTKNNPVLIGEPGVGKTAIAEGLAQAIVNQEVPQSLLKKRVVLLDLGEMIAGTKFRGEFEERLKDVISESIADDNEIILFIDEIHTLVGAGAAEGSLDAANILKPALSRGKIQVIGATTLDEYRKYIEKDKALERRFQPVQVDEPSDADALKILEGLRGVFEEFHALHITQEALEAAVKMSKRYIFGRYLPDKAIDLIDEACAKRGGVIVKKDAKLKKTQERIHTLEKKKVAAVERQEYKKAVAFKKEQEELQKQVKTVFNKSKKKQDIYIQEADIASIITDITGIPTKKIEMGELAKLKKLEEDLSEIIVGQDHVVKNVSQSILRGRVGLRETDRPMASFIFLGPTGVGKTELVKQLAQLVYEDKDALIKIDMSEFMEKHNVSRLLGAAAGYVGYEEGGQLTEAVRRKPYAVVLFDEIEKAHPEVFNILFQVMEDGYLTDSKGLKVDFKNTIIIMTSNIGSHLLTEEASQIGFSSSVKKDVEEAEKNYDEKSEEVLDELKQYFPPEFLGRIDKTFVFHALGKKYIKQILKNQLKDFYQDLKKKDITLEMSEVVVEALAKKAYNPEQGARGVRKVLLEDVEDNILDAIIANKNKKGAVLQLVRKPKKEGEFEVIVKKIKKKTVKK
ncbi:ATP-dependent Clp protease ATP-binding subunit ClpC [Candidatus Peregrinibacteria bacterium]|nr:MAG: ATP-dependent Clp protease ATP-binding subunit ClpC [Candidatus Peregrinibacteria bacterium]